MEIERMLYRRYKTSYADCETVLGSYDKATKTIEVMLPEGRKKKSGVRGKYVVNCPCIHISGSVAGMRRDFWGYKCDVVRVGQWIYKAN